MLKVLVKVIPGSAEVFDEITAAMPNTIKCQPLASYGPVLHNPSRLF